MTFLTGLIIGFIGGFLTLLAMIWLWCSIPDSISSIIEKAFSLFLYPYRKWHTRYRRTHKKLQIGSRICDGQGKIWRVTDIDCRMGLELADQYKLETADGLQQTRCCLSLDDTLDTKHGWKCYTDGLLELQKHMREKND